MIEIFNKKKRKFKLLVSKTLKISIHQRSFSNFIEKKKFLNKLEKIKIYNQKFNLSR